MLSETESFCVTQAGLEVAVCFSLPSSCVTHLFLHPSSDLLLNKSLNLSWVYLQNITHASSWGCLAHSTIPTTTQQINQSSSYPGMCCHCCHQSYPHIALSAWSCSHLEACTREWDDARRNTVQMPWSEESSGSTAWGVLSQHSSPLFLAGNTLPSLQDELRATSSEQTPLSAEPLLCLVEGPCLTE